MNPLIRPISQDDKATVTALLTEHWGAAAIVSRAKVHDASCLPGFIAEGADNKICGMITLHIEEGSCEVVTLDAFIAGKGVGRALLNQAIEFATDKALNRLWLITTNDNLNALGFYQKQGMRLVAVHRDAVVAARKIKPEIPLVAVNGIPICDEIELEILL